MSSTPGSTPSTQAPEHKPGDVYCSNCGYVLTGLTDAARCPECGRPLVEVLTRVPYRQMGKPIRFKSEATLFGVPVVHVALGPRPDQGEPKGVARGIIAVGDVAIGGIAVGGFATGIVAVGGLSVGVSSIGGMAIGVLTAMGGGAFGGYAVGGGAVGGIAAGGGALGIVAQGGGAVGVYARGGGVGAVYEISPRKADPEAVQMFQTLSPLLGRSAAPGAFSLSMGQPALSNFLIAMLVGLSVALVAIFKLRALNRDIRDPYRQQER